MIGQRAFLLVAFFVALHPAVGYAQNQPSEWQVVQITPKVRLLTKDLPNQPFTMKPIVPADAGDDWLKHFKVEITNTSAMPIYFIQGFLGLLDTVHLGTIALRPQGLELDYGDSKLLLAGNVASPEDQPLRPGEKTIIGLSVKQYEWLMNDVVKWGMTLSDLTRVALYFDLANFGDGTQWQGVYQKNDRPEDLLKRYF